MKSQFQIYMDYVETNRQCDKLESLAEELIQKGSNKLQEAYNGIRLGWKGENADAFLRKTSGLPDKINRTAANIRFLAKTMREIAKRTYDAEMEAVRIANERNYGK